MALAPSPIFEFITVTDSNPMPNAANRRTIRRHVMRDIGRGRRVKYDPVAEFHFSLRLVNPIVSARHEKILRNPLEHLFEASEYNNLRSRRDAVQHGNTNSRQGFPSEMFGVLVPSTAGQSEAVDATAEALLNEHDLYQGFRFSPRSILGQGRGIDPLAQYPVEMDIHMHGLVDNIHDDRNGNFRPFRDCWFPIAMLDAAAFHQVLSNSALQLGSLKPEGTRETVESMRYHTRAIESVQQRISDPVLGITDGIIVTIIAFACHDHMVENFDRWYVHMQGLQKILDVRGGIEVLNSNKLLRLVLMCADTTGSCAQDIPAYFPLPLSILPSPAMIPTYLPRGVLADKTVYLWSRLKPSRPQFSEIFSDTTHVTALINSQPPTIWTDSNFSGLWTNPLIHRLLAMQIPLAALDGNDDPDAVMQEVGRLGCILFFGKTRRKFGVHPVITRVQYQKIRTILSEHMIEWRPFEPLLLWTLTLGGIEASFSSDDADRSWFIERLSRVGLDMGLRSVEDAMRCLTRMPWVEGVYNEHAELLWNDVIIWVEIEVGQGGAGTGGSGREEGGDGRSGFFYWNHAAAVLEESANPGMDMGEDESEGEGEGDTDADGESENVSMSVTRATPIGRSSSSES